MSMLTRKGTIVRKNRGSTRGSRKSRRSVKSSTSSASGSFRRSNADSANAYSDEFGEPLRYGTPPPIRTFADVVLVGRTCLYLLV